MKALITAGGRGTRLRPITYTINKHLIPLAGKPMIFHAIEKVASAGISSIIINTNEGDQEIATAVGDGSRFGVKITYFEQKGGARGLADVVRQAEPFLGKSPFVFYLGDNIILGSIKKLVDQFKKEKLSCMLALAEVLDPTHFGVPVIENGKITKVIEKPATPPSPYAVTGIYLYDAQVFKAVKALKPSARGEYEISDAHTWLINKGYKVGYRKITGWWKDTGRAEDLLEANQLLLHDIRKKVAGKVDKDVSVQGNLVLGKRSAVQGKSVIRGPVSIGEGCVIRDSYIGPFTSIGNNVEVYGAEIENSIVFDHSDIHTNTRIVDSLIGANSSLISAHETLPSGHKLVIGSNSMVEL